MTTGSLTIQDNDTIDQYISVGESVFGFNFPVLEAEELKVSRNQVLLTYGTDYSIDGLGEEGGGEITLIGGASTPGDLYTLWLDMPIERLTGFVQGAAAILPSALNSEFGQKTRIEQMLRREIRNALRLAPDDPLGGQDMILPLRADRIGKYLAWDASGAPISASGTGADAGLREDLTGAGGNPGWSLVGIPDTEAELAHGVLVVNQHWLPGNINRYGTNAVPGTTDMRLALQRALDTRQTVYIPAGTYRISAKCRMRQSGQLILGEGALSILLTTTNVETLYSDEGVFGIVISQVMFSNTVSEAVTGPTEFHVNFGAGASGCTLSRCNFNTALTGAVVRTTHKGGVWFQGANLNNILDCTFGMAQIVMGSTDSTIRGGYVYSFAHEFAIKITSAGDVVVEGIRGILGGPSKGCIWIPAASYMNKIVNNYFGGSYTYINIGNGVTAVEQQMLQIIGNTFHEVDGIGVHLTSPANGSIVALNTFWAGHPKQNDATNLVPGNQDVLVDSDAFGATAVTIAWNVCNRFLGPVEDGMPGIGKSVAIEIETAANVGRNIIYGNQVNGVRYFDEPIVDGNLADIVMNNPGAPFSLPWTPADLSGAGLVFTGVSCRYIKDEETVTFWGALTFPATASGAGVVIGGLPFAPLAGQEGACGQISTDSAAAQKVKLVTGQQHFFLTDTVDAQQTNATCATKYFRFSGRYRYQ